MNAEAELEALITMLLATLPDAAVALGWGDWFAAGTVN